MNKVQDSKTIKNNQKLKQVSLRNKKVFIFFEGIDGSGKTTTINHIKQDILKRLPKCKVKILRDPDFNFTNKNIYDLMLKPVINQKEIYREFAIGRKKMYHYYFQQNYNVYLIDRCWISSVIHQNLVFPTQDKRLGNVIDGLYIWMKTNPAIAFSRITARTDNNIMDTKLTIGDLITQHIKYKKTIQKFMYLKVINNLMTINGNVGILDSKPIIAYIKHKLFR